MTSTIERLGFAKVDIERVTWVYTFSLTYSLTGICLVSVQKPIGLLVSLVIYLLAYVFICSVSFLNEL